MLVCPSSHPNQSGQSSLCPNRYHHHTDPRSTSQKFGCCGAWPNPKRPTTSRIYRADRTEASSRAHHNTDLPSTAAAACISEHRDAMQIIGLSGVCVCGAWPAGTYVYSAVFPFPEVEQERPCHRSTLHLQHPHTNDPHSRSYWEQMYAHEAALRTAPRVSVQPAASKRGNPHRHAQPHSHPPRRYPCDPSFVLHIIRLCTREP